MKLSKLRRKAKAAPSLRDGFRTFALHGDKVWGNSITWSQGAPEGNEGHVHGWCQALPVVGDRLLVKMQSGKWAAWVFTVVKHCDNPRDMFTGTVVGAIAYVEDDEVPVQAYSPTGVMADYV